MTKAMLYLANEDITELVDVIKVYIEAGGTATVMLDWNEGEDVPDELRAAVWVRVKGE